MHWQPIDDIALWIWFLFVWLKTHHIWVGKRRLLLTNILPLYNSIWRSFSRIWTQPCKFCYYSLECVPEKVPIFHRTTSMKLAVLQSGISVQKKTLLFCWHPSVNRRLSVFGTPYVQFSRLFPGQKWRQMQMHQPGLWSQSCCQARPMLCDVTWADAVLSNFYV